MNVVVWEYLKFRGGSVRLHLAGAEIEARTSDGVARLIGYFQDDADEMLIFLRHFLQTGDTFVDVGANIGTHSVIGSAVVGDTGRVLSIEADPETYLVFLNNLRINGIVNVTAHNVCVSSCLGTAEFNINRNSARNSLVAAGERAISLDMKRLDDIISADIGVALLKIDVEGVDYPVLEGSERLFHNGPPKAVIIERSRDADKITRFLKKHDYRLFDFDQKSSKLVPVSDSTENIYAIHPSGLDRVRTLLPDSSPAGT